MALILSVLTLLVLGLLAAGFVTTSMVELSIATNEMESRRALQLAKGGLAAAYQWMTDLPDPPCQGGGSTQPTPTSHDVSGIGRYDAWIDFDSQNSCLDSSSVWRYVLRSVGTTPAAVASEVHVGVTASRNTFAGYSWWWQTSDQGIWWTDWDRVDGRVHANDADVYLADDPIHQANGAYFGQKVTLAGECLFQLTGDGNPSPNIPEGYATFVAGYETGVPPCGFPPDLGPTLSASGLTLRGETTIVLQADGTLRVTNAYAGFVDSVLPLPPSGVISVQHASLINRGNLRIQGTLRGRATIVAAGAVRIVGDLLYHDVSSPMPPVQSAYMLGLIAQNDILITNVVQGAADGDRCIYGFLLSSVGSALKVDSLAARGYEGVLVVHGGIAGNSLAPTLRTSQGQIVGGFGTDVTYDQRGLMTPPPYYPVVDCGDQQRWNIAKVDSSWTEVFPAIDGGGNGGGERD
jgi:hypothetical protein